MIKFLIIDDSVFSQKVTALLLKKYLKNIEIAFAGDGVEGLKKYEEVKPDYIFLDLLMPNLGGIDFIKMVSQRDNAKIIVVTADVQKSIKEEIQNYQVMSFINKPLDDEKMQVICNRIKDEEDGKKEP